MLPILVMSIAAQTDAAAGNDDAEATIQELVDTKARAFLSELSVRRRMTTLFVNRQSAFHGVQENFVNTSRGNLTFLIRDLVRVGAMPIVLGRVHDSTLAANADFGPGWKLTVDESIISGDGDSLTFVDASNTAYALRVVGSEIPSGNPGADAHPLR